MARTRIPDLPAKAPARRGLLRAGWDKTLLVLCIVGLLAAWLTYGALGAAPVGRGPAAAAALPTASSTAPYSSAPAPASAATPGTGKSAVPAAPKRTTPAAVQVPKASAPLRITYPAARIDVAVHPLEPSAGEAASQSIVPPETMDGYWLAPFGVPGAGSTNTTYVVGHSWQGVDAPFNRLSTLAAAGDKLTVHTATGAISYKVDSVTTYVKSTLKDSPVWAVVPNRVVLISCYTGDLWGQNVVVVASPVKAG
ncbi:class F sortase [Arthrobacter sp. Hor0625]|uniref:class F sortase n=1 Tax=Arthrobacter sp. Hor0625 TaxID=3457358 RepID=UPI00403E3DDF